MKIDFQPIEASDSGIQFTPEASFEPQVDEKYGGASGEIKAALAGAARGATFGLSDLALTKTGLVDPETLEGLKQANPTASTLGEVGGTVGSFLIPGGGAVGAVSKLAGAAGKKVAGQIASKALSNIAAKTVGSAIEGAVFGAGNVVSEYALGDPDLTAQKAAAQIGLGGILGGALGTALGGAELAKPYANLAAKKFKDGAVTGYSKVSSSATGLDEKLIKKAFKVGPANLSAEEIAILEGKIAPKSSLAMVSEDLNTDWLGLKAKQFAEKGAAKTLGTGSTIADTALLNMVGVPTPVAAGVTATMEAIHKPLLTAQRLAKIEGLVQKTNNQIRSATNKFFNVVPGNTLGQKLISESLADLDDYSSEEKSFEKRVERIEQITSTPDNLLQVMNSATESLYAAAPEVATQMNMTAVAGLEFLAGKVPKSSNTTPLAAKFVPPKSQVMRFNHYYDIVEKPTRALKELVDGTLNLDTIEVLDQVYPRLYGQMKDAIVDKMTSHKDPIPYKKRLMLSQFLQAPMDESMLPQNIMRAQMTYKMPSQKSNGMVAPPKGGSDLKVFNVASRAQTETDAVSSREKP